MMCSLHAIALCQDKRCQFERFGQKLSQPETEIISVVTSYGWRLILSDTKESFVWPLFYVSRSRPVTGMGGGPCG